MDNITIYPEYRQVAIDIQERVKAEGYGFLMSMEELHDALSIEQPKEGTYATFREYAFKWLAAIEGLKEELIENNICLANERGQGYRVLVPNEQIEKIPKKHMEQARNQIRKAIRTLINVDENLLSEQLMKYRVDELSRMSALKTMMDKHKKIC